MSTAVASMVTTIQADIAAWKAKIATAQAAVASNEANIALWTTQLNHLIDMLNVLTAMTGAGMTTL